MQYLLTQEEYDALLLAKQQQLSANKDKLQKFATLAANHIPVKLSWAPHATPAPWGCILDQETDPGYCDECPSQIICPSTKRYSK